MDSLAVYASQQSAPPLASLAPSPPGTLRYGYLRQVHAPCPPHDRGYDIRVWTELDDLYRGGYQILEHADRYLPKTVNETNERWRERVVLASYVGYFGRIVQAYVGAIFENTVSVAPAGDAENPDTPGELPEQETYDAFGRDADLKGCGFENLLRLCTEISLVKQKGLICVDFPAPGTAPQTRAESDALGTARPYAYVLEPECLSDWEIEEEVQRVADLGGGKKVHWTVGRFKWCIIKSVHRKRVSPDELRAAPIEEYRIWRKLEDGTVIWQIYRTPPIVDGQRIPDETPIPLVAESATTLKEIPVVELKLPEALWLGNIIGPLNLEHWRRRSALLAAEQRTMLPFPIAFLGGEIPGFQEEIMAQVQQDPGRAENLKAQWEAKGFGVLGKGDDVKFVGPDADPFDTVDKQLEKLVDEIYRVAGVMAGSVSGSGAAVGRSGLSKAFDAKDFITAVSAVAAIVADAAKRVYTVISEARGEEVVWNVHGLSGYEEMEDRATVLEEALQVDAVTIPSVTFKREYKYDIARKLLPGRDPATMATIKDEINGNTSEEDVVAAKTPVVPDEEDEGAAEEKSADGTPPANEKLAEAEVA